jgi:imidazolonepropionase-like amidohydrolase
MRNRHARRLLPHLAIAAICSVAATPSSAERGPDRVIPSGTAEGTWAFTDVTVIPMDGERTLPNQTVVVVDGVITMVGPSGSVEIPEDATTIDGSDRYLMPGLAEMHAHVPPQGRPAEQDLDELMFLYVANGITTIRGMLGSPYQIDLAREIGADEHLAPMFYAAAPSLNGNTASTPAEAEAGIRAAASAGYHLMKIHPGIPLAAWDRMVRVANEVGLTFGGHVPADVGIRHALETGISTVDHVDGYLEGSASDAFIAQQEAAGFPIQVSPALLRNLDEGKMRELAELSLETGVFVVPTQYLWENLYMQVDAEEILTRPDMAYVSEQQRNAWRNQNSGRPKMSGEDASLFRAGRDRMLEILVETGVPLLMGTDSPQLFNVPGFALHRELAKIAEIGIDEYTILESGTRNVGRYVSDVLGMDGNFGTVAPGQRADLVLLEANPLDDLDNLTARAGVMVRGAWVSAEEIEAGLEAIAARHAN